MILATEITMSDNYRCAAEKSCFSPNSQRHTKTAWAKSHLLSVDRYGTVYARVFNDDEELFDMDCITGSLYQDGKCLSSDSLKAVGIHHDQQLGIEILMGKKAQKV